MPKLACTSWGCERPSSRLRRRTIGPQLRSRDAGESGLYTSHKRTKFRSSPSSAKKLQIAAINPTWMTCHDCLSSVIGFHACRASPDVREPISDSTLASAAIFWKQAFMRASARIASIAAGVSHLE